MAVSWYLFEDGDLETFIDRLSVQTKKDGKLSVGDQVVVFLGRTPGKETKKLRQVVSLVRGKFYYLRQPS